MPAINSGKETFDWLKKEVLKVDPVSFSENYLTIEGREFKITDNGWKFMADLYRHIIYKAMSDEGKPIVLVKGRQVAATTMATNLGCYLMGSGNYGVGERPPISFLHAFPQLELMYDFAKDKLEKTIRNSIIIDNPNKPGKVMGYMEFMKDSARDATDSLTFKQFKNGNSWWCNSIGNEGTRVLGRRFDGIFFDEVQKMTEKAVGIAKKCLTWSQYGPVGEGFQIYFGTPRHKNSYFHKIWEKSDKRFFHLGCSGCGEYFELYSAKDPDKWEEIWLYEMIVKCPRCGEEQDKREAVDRGKWIPSVDSDTCEFAGFHFNQLFIPIFPKETVLKEKPENSQTNSEVTWMNEVLGEFYSGEGLPITFDEIYTTCRDPDRLWVHPKHIITKRKSVADKTLYLGFDWGGKPDIDGAKRGQSFSVMTVLGIEHENMYPIEYATKLKRLKIDDKIKFVEEMFRLYRPRLVMGDIGYAEDLSMELKGIFGDKYQTVRNSASVAHGVKYHADELEVVIDKDRWLGEIFDGFRRGKFRFPWASYEQMAWYIEHCCSMESKDVVRGGVPHQMFVKGKEPNDGLMSLLCAYVAYKFNKTHAFKLNPNSMRSGGLRPILAYLPKLR